MRPLDGITVVSLEHAISGPFCTRQLADQGARVIKIERPGVGDFARGYDERVRGVSSQFIWCNRSKESLTLDVKHAEAKNILEKLIEKADVLVQNLAPGAAARLGLSYNALSAKHPRLIVCDISGYGSEGPYRDKKAYDLLIQSEAGFLSITGTPEAPAKAGISIADISAGMYAYSNILAALIQRSKTGCGRHIDISLLETMGEWMSYPLYYAFEGAAPPPRTGAAHGTIAPYGPFQAGDEGTVMLGLQNEREWNLFCERVLEMPDLADDARFRSNSRRTAARDELEGNHHPSFLALHRKTSDRTTRRRANCQLPRKRNARRMVACAIEGARALGGNRYASGKSAGAAAARDDEGERSANGSRARARRAYGRDFARIGL